MGNIEQTTADSNKETVQAYAKLQGEEFCYYIRTLQVTLGRKVKKPDSVDIPLGNIKSVSRQHARLFYNFTTQRFEMMVFGKNGAFVNEQFVEKGVTVPLENKTKIQIGEVSFIFLLPRMELSGATGGTEAPRNEGFGYISTPQQLEKNCKLKKPTQLASSNITSSEKDAPLEQKKQTIYRDEINTEDWVESSPEDPSMYESKDIKPPYSYASLIAQAINSSRSKRMTLNGIYTFITTNYPYYQMASNGWQNSIRHNLSLNKAFIKMPRKDSEPGKGAFWTIDESTEGQFIKTTIPKKNKRSSSGIQSSSKRRKTENGGEVSNEEDDEEDDGEVDDDEIEDIDCEDSDDVEEGCVKEEEEPQQELSAEVKTQKRETAEGDKDSVQIKVEPVAFDLESVVTGQQETSEKEQAAIKSTEALQDQQEQPQQKQGQQKQPQQEQPQQEQPQQEQPQQEQGQQKQGQQEQPQQKQPQQPHALHKLQQPQQQQLQNAIRQHLLDPIKHPLPPSIAQLLPQAIAQLPPQLANQLSGTLQSVLKTPVPKKDSTNSAAENSSQS